MFRGESSSIVVTTTVGSVEDQETIKGAPKYPRANEMTSVAARAAFLCPVGASILALFSAPVFALQFFGNFDFSSFDERVSQT